MIPCASCGLAIKLVNGVWVHVEAVRFNPHQARPRK